MLRSIARTAQSATRASARRGYATKIIDRTSSNAIAYTAVSGIALGAYMYSNRERYFVRADTAPPSKPAVAEDKKTSTDSVVEKAKKKAKPVVDKAREAKETVKEETNKVKEKVKDETLKAKETVKEKTNKAKEKVNDETLKAEEVVKAKIEESEDSDESPESSSQSAAFDPETGEINWDCPCLGGMAHGPCGEEFKAAFSCFVYSEAEPKGMDCIEKFRDMQTCFRQHPDVYGDEIDEEEEEEAEDEQVASSGKVHGGDSQTNIKVASPSENA